ncbi:MAG: YobA family protein [Bacillota bacterium]
MNKLIITVIMLLFSLSLIGYNPDTTAIEPGIEGYVVGKADDQILVVSSVPKDYSSTGGVKEFYNAIWFSNAPKDISIGQKVQVWYDMVLESYPGKSKAKQVSVVPSSQPEHANLTEPEVIRKVLTSQGIGNAEVPVIKAVHYVAEKDIWIVHIKQGKAELNVQVMNTPTTYLC